MKKKLVEFSTVDEMFVHMSTPRHPYNIHLEVRTAGRLDATRLRGAVDEALRLHPMARAQRAEHGALDRSLHWEIHPSPSDPVVVVEACDDASLVHSRNQLVSLEPGLAQAPPMMIWLVRHPDGDALIFNLHHAVADGVGSLRLLQSVARAYAGEEDEVSGPDPLKVQAEGLDVELAKQTRAAKLKDMAYLTQSGMGKVSTLCPKSPEDRAGYYCTAVTLEGDELSALDPKRHADATLNDLFVAAMHKSIEKWNRKRKGEAAKIRIPVPVNLRPASWSREVVGNYFMTFMTNTEKEQRRSAALLMETVSEQTRRGKQDQVAEKMYLAMKRRLSVPVFSRELIMKYAGNNQGSSAFLTNLGRIGSSLSFGDAGDAAAVWITAPVPMPVGMGLGIISLGGHLNLAFRHCAELMNAQAGQDFSGLYRETLQWVGAQ